MSLRVWLPLTGDLHNQGLEDVSLTASVNSSISQEGKIGSCYQFGTSTSSYLKFNDVNFIKSFTECSVSLWIKILTWQSSYNTYFQFGFSGVNWAHYIFGLLRNSTGSTLCFTISNGTSATNANCLTPSLELNKWYHITLTYKSNHCKIYINGQMIKDYSTSIVPDFSKVTFGTIGAGGPSGGSYQTNCLINDFRVYDNALSQKEIKELSRGLILHYKLAGIELGNDNLYKNSSLADLTSSNLSTKIRYASSYIPEITTDGLKFTWSGSSAREIGLWLDKSLEVDTQYTLSFIYKSNMAIGTSFYLRNGTSLVGYWAQTTIPAANNWTLYTCTFTPASYNSGDITTGNSLTLFYSGYTANKQIEIKQYSIKLEKGSTATAWCPAKTDSSYLSQIDTTIYDSSGYGHNATIVGTTTIDSTSPRYSSAIHMNNTSSANRIDADPLTIPTEAITVSFWMYTIKTNSYVMYIDQNLSFCVNAAGDAFWLSRTNSKGFSTAKLTTGVWHHIVLIRQDTTYKAYIDAEEIPRNMGNNAWTHSNGRLYLLNRNYNNSYAANASIVDFRMYVTALSDEDILELYQTSESVDNFGNLYSYTYFEELNSEISVTQNGIITAKEFYNQDNLTSFREAGSIYTQELKEI